MSLETLREAADAVEETLNQVEEPRREVGTGADGQPTLKIDREAEEAAIEVLRGLDSKVVSEETGTVGDGEGLVVLDPLDGTGNAVRGIPFYSFSVAHLRSDGSTALVRDLVNGEEFTHRDGTSRLDGEELQVNDSPEVSGASLSIYVYGTGRGDELNRRVRRTRTMGSAALELCYVAAGRLDGMASLRRGLSPTDYAAGRLMVEGAGGAVEVTGEGSMEEVDRGVDLLAGHPSLVADMGRRVE